MGCACRPGRGPAVLRRDHAQIHPAALVGPTGNLGRRAGDLGGIATAAVVGVWRVRRSREDVGRFMDAVAPSLLIASGIGRIGNVTLAAALVWLGHNRRVVAPGLFALYVTGYSGFRVFEETLRVDPSQYFLGLRLNFYVASALTIFGAAWFLYTQREALRRRAWRAGAAEVILVVVARLGATAGCGHESAPTRAARSAGQSHQPARDPNDRHVLAAAVAGRADVMFRTTR